MKAIAHTTRDIASLVDIELPKPSPGPRDCKALVLAMVEFHAHSGACDTVGP